MTGEVNGNEFLFRTHANQLNPDMPYWADCKGAVTANGTFPPCILSLDGNFFGGFGWDSSNVHVEFWAYKQ